MSAKGSITIGFELEISAPAPGWQNIVTANGFGVRQDSSILDDHGAQLPTRGTGAGIELVTPIYELTVTGIDSDSPVISGFEAVINAVTQLCAAATSVNSSCGLHVHLGRPNGERTEWNVNRRPNTPGGPMSEWKTAQVRTWLLIGRLMEQSVFSMVPDSRAHRRHCQPISRAFRSEQLSSYYPLRNLRHRKHDNIERYCWLNLIETSRRGDPLETRVGYARSKPTGTVEIRALGETKDAQYICAWARLWTIIAASVAYLPSDFAIARCYPGSQITLGVTNALLRMKAAHAATVRPTPVNENNGTAEE